MDIDKIEFYANYVASGDSIIGIIMRNDGHNFSMYIHTNGSFKISLYLDSTRCWTM